MVDDPINRLVLFASIKQAKTNSVMANTDCKDSPGRRTAMRVSARLRPACRWRSINFIDSIMSYRCAHARRETMQFTLRKVRRQAWAQPLVVPNSVDVSTWLCWFYLETVENCP